jgi:hypothetical protein
MEPPKQHSTKAGLRSQSLLEAHLTLVASPVPALEQLIKKFAPVICSHPEAAFKPVAVEEYLQKAWLVSDTAKSRLPATPPALASLSRNDSHFYLEPGEGVSLSGESPMIKAYVHAKAAGDAYTDLQYWLFYAQMGSASAMLKWLIDGTIKGHEGKLDLNPLGLFNGSWERITVRVNNATRAAEQVYFPQSGAGAWLSIDQVHKRGSQVVAYASKNGRSFYPTAENYSGEKVRFNLYSSQLEFCLQQETGNGDELDLSGICELISAEYLGEHQPAEPLWLNFPGHWGNPDPGCLSVPLVKRMVLSTFGKPLEFLLSGHVLGELVNYLRVHFSKEYQEISLSPRARPCWAGDETGG